MELALDFETHAGRPLPPTPQSKFAGTVIAGEGQSGAPGSNPDGQGGREGVHPSGPDYQPLPLFGAAGGRPGGRSEGTPPFHETHGGVAPSEAPAAVQCRTVGTAAAIMSGEAAPETEARPGQVGRHAKRQCAAAGTMPRQRRGEESSQGVRERLLCRTRHTGRGAQRHTVQSGGTKWRHSNTCAGGRGRALHTTPVVRCG